MDVNEREFFAFMDGRLVCLIYNIHTGNYHKAPIPLESERKARAFESSAGEAYRLWRDAPQPFHGTNDPAAYKRKPENIVIDYPCNLHITGFKSDTVYYCLLGLEFFVDEHGSKWVKFIPGNGVDRDKEHILLITDLDFLIVRR